jgi:hypothetical protein
MIGSYTLASLHFASDGSGGTLVTDPPVAAGQSEGVVDLSLPSSGGNAALSSSSRRPGAATGIGDFASVKILGDQSDSLVGPSSDKRPFTFGSSGMAVHDVAFSGISLGQAGPVADRLTGKLAGWFSGHDAGGSAGGNSGLQDRALALLGQYMASSFVSPSDQSVTPIADSQRDQYHHLSLPHAA